MSEDFWVKQDDKPLYDDLIWARPENKNQAGRLLIIGGNAHEFSAPGEAYQAAEQAGVGRAKVLLPMALQKTIGEILENTEYAPSNKSGSFSRTALTEWLVHAHWADGILIAGDLGRNSETAIVLESFLEKYSGQLTITKDAVDNFSGNPSKLLNRPETTLVVSFGQLQKLASSAGVLFKFSMGVAQIVQALHDLTSETSANIITEHNGIIFVAANGQISTTKIGEQESWRVKAAASASVWWLQNPGQTFKALTTSIVEPA